ncbi:AbrB/MazE/SpoVT family DNA-binding domain-containing protein [Synechocystis sp. PCC 7509]|uniref:AbrB/MazE/SpoVT family DNA-binding domain-containing protein n=1 Tax=Synechocystis sp. PCC 7509 TaxID=927677 RepID=UPI0002AC1169|nr:AbrB/MazE/SpoVT family DNA-binding domain-containing protein [Synechocystis sp. PCC 7509]
MKSATITSKGQVTIPKEIRDYLKLEIGSKIDFVIDENGTVKIIPLTVSVTALSGMLRRPGLAAATIEEDMELAIAQGACDCT